MWSTAGGEFRINSTTADDQVEPSVAALSGGGFVVAWSSSGQDGDELGVFAQLFDGAGNATGAEFQINITTALEQNDVTVTGLSGGGFVAAWESEDQDGADEGVFARVFDAAGTALGGEIQVNSTTANSQDTQSIAALSGGGFVVVWEAALQDGSGLGVYLQRFDAKGNTVGSETRANTTTSANQDDPTVAGLSDGGFVVVWESFGQDLSSDGVFGQRFDAAGATAGSEFPVNSATTGNQDTPVVAGFPGGGFIVVWESENQDGDDVGVFAQRFDASGSTVGAEFRVNTTTASQQNDPQVAVFSDDSFVVVWESLGQDGSSEGLFGQRYDSSATPAGGEFIVNAFLAGNQDEPSIVALADDSLVVTWQSDGQDGDGSAVVGQVYDGTGAALGRTSTSLVIDGGAGDDVLSGGTGDDTITFDAADVTFVSGNAGTDTLLIDGAGIALDLGSIAGVSHFGFEAIDLTGTGNNSLTPVMTTSSRSPTTGR